jgi:hypothetical protein
MAMNQKMYFAELRIVCNTGRDSLGGAVKVREDGSREN